MNDKDYIKSLEGFMIKVAKELKCLPDFVDPENGNDHLFRILKKISSPENETVEQWEKRTCDIYPETAPVWRTEILKDSKGEYIVNHLTTWKNYKPYGSPEVIKKWLKSNQPIIANYHGKPE